MTDELTFQSLQLVFRSFEAALGALLVGLVMRFVWAVFREEA